VAKIKIYLRGADSRVLQKVLQLVLQYFYQVLLLLLQYFCQYC